MVKAVEQPRHFCTLGAQQTVVAIKKSIPILHSGPGCGVKLFRGLSTDSGYQGIGYGGGSTIPCTNTTEREVVFGGEKRLKEVIDGAFQVLNADLFVVLTGCTADIVGDDIGQVVSEYQDEGKPIVYAETGGFKGTNLKGHEIVIKAIVDQYVGDVKPNVEKGLVNLWSVVPYQDPFWSGDLGEIKRLLEGIGLKVNIFFGPDSEGVSEWKSIPNAQFNLVLHPWVGIDTAKHLEKKYGTPFLHYPTLPVGGKETTKFLREVGKFAGIDEEVVEKFIRKEEERYYYYIDRAADFFVEFRYDLASSFYNINEAAYSLGISKFLINELGISPGIQYITDDTPEKYQELIRNEFKDISPYKSAEVNFEVDGGKISEEIKKDIGSNKPIILGSSWDRDLINELNGFGLNIALPVQHRLVMNKHYVGYSGGLTLTEDIYTTILDTYK